MGTYSTCQIKLLQTEEEHILFFYKNKTIYMLGIV